MNKELWTIGRMLNWTEQYFREKGIATPRLDGEVLLSHMLGKERIYCYTHYEQPLSANELKQYKEFVIRRINGESVAYITEKKEFMGLSFSVNKNVLVPRPDTETLVEGILDLVGRHDQKHILDLCTGSGAILMSILHYLPECTGIGSDISPSALAVAKKNQDKFNLTDRSELRLGNLWEIVKENEQFDIIVSNPPYIKTEDIKTLSKEVKNEPVLALDGGVDGLDCYRTIIGSAYQYLRENGVLAVEIGCGQEIELDEMARRTNKYEEAKFFKDLQGIVRVIMWRKRK